MTNLFRLVNTLKNSRLWMLVAGALVSMPAAFPKSVSVGPFEVVTAHHRYFSGWETGTNSFTEYDTYGLRYHGKIYGFDAPDGMFENEKRHYSAFTQALIMPTEEPAVMVMVGDPNNTFFYYMVHEKDGSAQAEVVSRGRNVDAFVWLDADNGQPLVRPRQETGKLSAGTLLLIGSDCVLNVRTLEKHALSDVPGVYFQFSRVLMLSQDRRVVVRLAQKTDKSQDYVLVATDFLSDRSTVLPIDRKRMRFNDPAKLDAAWVDHHFAWSKDDDGHDILKQRPDFAVLPHHGDIIDQGGGEVRYRIENAQPEIVNMMAETMQREFGAKLQVPDPEPSLNYKPPCGTYLIDGHPIKFTLYSEASISTDKPGSEELIRRIGKQIDQQLATGAFDEMFKD